MPISNPVTTLSSGVNVVSSGQSLANLQVGSGVDLLVQNGGNVSSLTVIAGGVVDVFSGGHATSTTVSNGGTQWIEGGTALDTFVNMSGVEQVAEGTATSTVVNNGGVQWVYYGIASNTVVNAGGQLNVNWYGPENSSHGSAVSATIKGGYAFVNGYSADMIVSSGGNLYVSLHGLATNTVIMGGASVAVDGSAVNTFLHVSANMVVDGGGAASFTVISSGAHEFVQGGQETAGQILSGGYMGVLAAGHASAIVDNGHLAVTDQSTIGGAVIGSGAWMDVYGSAVASNTDVLSGGLVRVGGVTSGMLMGTTIESFGVVSATTGSQVSGTVISSGGELVVMSGLPGPVDLRVGGTIYLEGVPYVSGETVSLASASNTLFLNSGGTLTSFTVSGGTFGETFAVSAGLFGGTLITALPGPVTVSSGQTSSGLVASPLRGVAVFSGGVASGTVVSSGGTALVVSGAVASAALVSTTLQSGGTIDLAGLAFSTGGIAEIDPRTDVLNVNEGGTVVSLSLAGSYAGKHAVASADGSGGTAITLAAGTAYGTDVFVGSGSSANWDWNTAANWSEGWVPTSADDVVITNAAPVVQLDTNGFAHSITMITSSGGYLDIGFSNGSPTLMLGTSAHIGGGGQIQIRGGGTVVAPLGVTIDTGSVLYALDAVISGNLVNNSTRNIYQGSVATNYATIDGSLSGTGTTDVQSTLDVAGAVTGDLAFNYNTYPYYFANTLRLDDPAQFSGVISGVQPYVAFFASYQVADATGPSVIDLRGLAGGALATGAYQDGVLTVNGSSQTVSLAVTPASGVNLADAALTFTDDGYGGTDVGWVAGLTDTWIGTVGGDWTAGSNWSLGFAPGPYDTAVIATAAPAIFTVASGATAQASTIDFATSGETLAIAGGLSVGTGSQTLNGGTIAIAGGALSQSLGLNLDQGTITLADGALSSRAIYTIANSSGGNFSFAYNPSILGSNLTVTQLAGPTDSVSITANGTITNNGTINAGVKGGSFTIGESNPNYIGGTSLFTYQGQIINNGTINVSNGDTLNTSIGTDYFGYGGTGPTATNSFTNTATGVIHVSSGAAASFGGDTWSNQGTITVGQGSTLTLQGAFSSLAGVFNNGGTLMLDGSTSSPLVTEVTSGLLMLNPSFAASTVNPVFNYGVANLPYTGAITGAALTIDQGATLELQGYAASDWNVGLDENTQGTVSFGAPSATLTLDRVDAFVGTLAQLAAGDVIDFANTSITSASFGASGLTVTASDGTTATYGTGGTVFAPNQYSLASDGHGGTLLTLLNVPADAVWENSASGGGLWTNAANWFNGAVPTAASDVLVNNDVTSNVTVVALGAVSVNSLSIDGGTGAYAIYTTFSDALTVAGTISVAGGTWSTNVLDSIHFSGDIVRAAAITAPTGIVYARDATITAASIVMALGELDHVTTLNGNVTAEQIVGNNHLVINGNLVGSSTDQIGGQSGFVANMAGVSFGNIGNASVLELNGSVDAHIGLIGPTAAQQTTTLVIDHPASFTGYVQVDGTADLVDLGGIAPGSLSAASFDASGLAGFTGPNTHGVVITGTDGSGAAVTLKMVEPTVAPTSLALAAVITSDGNGGSLVSLVPVYPQVTWATDVSGDWNTAANWVGGAVPTEINSVLINGDVDNAISISASGSITAASITVDPGTAHYIGLSLNTATVAGSITFGAGSAGLSLISGTIDAGAIVAPTAAVYVGVSGSATDVTVNTATLEAGGLYLGNVGSGQVTINGNVEADSDPTFGTEVSGQQSHVTINGSFTGLGTAGIPGEAYALLVQSATFELNGAASALVAFEDTGSGAPELVLDQASGFTGQILMSSTRDTVDFAGVAPGGLAVSGAAAFGGVAGEIAGIPVGVAISGVDSTGRSFTVDLYQDGETTTSPGATARIVSDGHGGSLVSLVSTPIVTVGANKVVLAAAGTTYHGGGNDQFYVTPATIADTINGGGNNSSLGVLNGGTSVMGANITGFGQVHLMGGTLGTTGFTFTANATQGLIVVGSLGNDVITVGDASQTIYTEGLNSIVRATAATAGALVAGVRGNPTLEITGGGTATLNANDGHGLIVQIDQAMFLNMGLTAFISAVAETSGSTVTAGAPFQTLVTMAGGTTFIGAIARNTYADTLQGTTTGLNGDTFVNFGKSDAIDITDVLPTSSIVYTQTSSTQGSLAFGGSSVTLQGSFNPAKFQMVTDGGAGTLVKYLG